ncbi:Adenylate cyclase 2 [Planctomycetes bacterium Pla163]|uniref:Adenylate cyclase 2 n=1 Tax=Rohdeia mirabilis TaxID=2528008 RepID=A0A518CV50_9BACT|nr:Adenylate cyclase 2 [Planctomycetes bacterium Pla163]
MENPESSPDPSHPSRPCSLLVADIVSSTALYERLGDKRARAMVASGLELMSLAVRLAGGRVVKTMGDGLLACFEGVGAAKAGLGMLERIYDEPVDIRVGVHVGDVIEVDGDIFGDAVNTVARIASIARANEILISRPLWEQIPAELQELARPVPHVSVKGKREPLELYSVLGHGSAEVETGMTMMVTAERPSSVRTRTIRLAHLGRMLELAGEGAVKIGRSLECDIPIAHHEASRLHARVFYRRPDFLIEDTSTNGTYLVPDNGRPVHLSRRETVLLGKGRLYPGANPGSDDAVWIEFEVG